MPVGELLDRISSAELTEWRAFFALEREDTTNKPKEQQRSPGELKGALRNRVQKKRKR